MKSLNETKYNKVKELLEKGFHTSMSDFNPTKQSFYRGNANRNTRRTFRNEGASNGFDVNGISKTPSKPSSSNYISSANYEGGGSRSVKKPTLSYSKRSSVRSNNEYGNTPTKRKMNSNNTISAINTSGIEVMKNEPYDIYTDTDDNKTIKSTPNHIKKQKKISRRNIKRLDENSVPRAPDFR
jgi:hypothetical protein